ncbi:MAG: preprotein translocase subunit YajC [Anaerolineae bacterium]|nr:preprotein translocase subunit YajC [Anaerolineae bacterium]
MKLDVDRSVTMEQSGGFVFWGALIAAMVVLTLLPRWMNRRRMKQREGELQVGDRVLTIGGLVGELTHIDFEDNSARIKLAEGVEIQIMPGAISGKRGDQSSSVQDADGVGADETE